MMLGLRGRADGALNKVVIILRILLFFIRRETG